MNKSDVKKLILILFPHWSHYDWNGWDKNFYFGEYGPDKMRHTNALYVIHFTNPAFDKEIVQLTIFPDGINCWRNARIQPLPNQFKAHNFLKQFFPTIV